MTRFAAVAACIFVAVALCASPVLCAQQAKKPVKMSDVEAGGDPLLVFKRFQSAWRAGNARELADLAGGSPVLVEIRGSGRRAGYFTKPQLLYIFKELFESSKQLDFAFVRYHNIEQQDRRIYGIAQRSYRSASSGGLLRDKVYVTLAKEDSRWAVAEIKSTW